MSDINFDKLPEKIQKWFLNHSINDDGELNYKNNKYHLFTYDYDYYSDSRYDENVVIQMFNYELNINYDINKEKFIYKFDMKRYGDGGGYRDIILRLKSNKNYITDKEIEEYIKILEKYLNIFYKKIHYMEYLIKINDFNKKLNDIESDFAD